MWKRRPLWITELYKSLDLCACEHDCHNSLLEFTGLFHAAVEDVGNAVPIHKLSDRFSNCPELHSPVLEKRTQTQLVHNKAVVLLFHFSSRNDGGYGKYLRNTHTDSPCPSQSACLAIHQPALPWTPYSDSACVNPTRAIYRGIQTKTTFSTLPVD